MLVTAHSLTQRAAAVQNTGTSLVDTFDDRQIETHINKMRITMQQQQQRQPMNLMQQAFNPADACAVCNCTKLLFEPPLVYCTSCGQKIKRSQVFYCTQADAGEAQQRTHLPASGSCAQ
jgi:E1A/CREB-binding protein